MSKPLPGTKIAVLVANGFNQQDFTDTQKILNTAGASLKVISPDQGLVNGWEGAGWGHHFAVEQQLSTALGADFGVLVIPGGQRSLDKLKTTAHTRRFIASFIASGKPVISFGDAAGLLAFAGQCAGRTMAGPDSAREAAVQAGAVWTQDSVVADDNLYTGRVDSVEERGVFASGIVAFLTSRTDDLKQAA